MSELVDLYLQMLGWVGNVFFIAGAYILTKKKPRIYAMLNIMGNVAYIIQGACYRNWSLFGLSILLGSLSLLLLLRWKEDDAQ
jgi:hypothetical protein